MEASATQSAEADIEEAPKRHSGTPFICTCGSKGSNAAAPQDFRDSELGELFQRSLFATYDIEVEFERRFNHLDRLIAASGNDVDVNDLAERLELAVTLCPLRLSLDERSVEIIRSGSMEGTGEPVYEFVYRLPYSGDTELWSLAPASAPSAADESQPAGEIYRQRLIVVLYACTSAEAEEWLSHTIASVQYIIRAQAREVEQFNESLRGLIWRKLVHHRAGVNVLRKDGEATVH